MGSHFDCDSFKPGDYISINLPRVALYEFHPFTISSAPEDMEYISVHMKAVGTWTKRVHQRFKDMSETNSNDMPVKVYRADLKREQEMPRDDEVVSESHSATSDTSAKKEPIVINGPYSSCARYIFDCKHAVLIGGGIGITPYASILSSLMAQFRASRTVCNHCQGANYPSNGLAEHRRLKKVDFIWVNGDQKNFEWFLHLLSQFEREQEQYLASNPGEQRFLDIHLYFTEIKNNENIGNAPLNLVTNVWAQVAGEDIFTSLKSKTHIGRPDWDDLFRRFIAGDENASTTNDVNVFFCGPTTMGETIREKCTSHRFHFHEEKF